MKEIKSSVFATSLVFCGLMIGLLLSGNSTIAQRVAAITGNGTTGHLAKWVNSSGALGDSSITEDKQGNISIAGGIKFPDGSIQTSASTDSHFRQIKFKIPFNQTRTIDLPVIDRPVRIEVSVTNMVAANNSLPNPHFRTLIPAILDLTCIKESQTNFINLVSTSSSGRPFENGRLGDSEVGIFLKSIPQTGIIELSTIKSFLEDDVVVAHDFDVCVNMWY